MSQDMSGGWVGFLQLNYVKPPITAGDTAVYCSRDDPPDSRIVDPKRQGMRFWGRIQIRILDSENGSCVLLLKSKNGL